jgi:hypothetical protein
MRSRLGSVVARRTGPRTAALAAVTAALVVGSLLSVPGGPRVAAATAGADTSFTTSETITRKHLVNGAEQVVDERTFDVTVDQTTLLRDRQEINVSWSGAHPTGGLVGDQNSGLAAEQEYPVVMIQCRGVDSANAPAAQRLSPETCWTHTPRERSQSDASFNFPSFRLDRYATPADRKAMVGVPSPVPSACADSLSSVEHWVPFYAADGTVYTGGPFGCAGMAPEAVNFESALQPSNTTYGATDKSGNGSAEFAISTAESNASLGCSDKVTCSLVIIPIMGISCDPAGTGLPPEDQPSPQDVQDEAFRRCSATGKYQPGEFSPGTVNQEDLAVAGELWWSASNWGNRISVPLTFAQPANICNLVNNSAPVYIYGSQLMAQATAQWAPRFCLDPKLFKLQHVLTGEPQAKNLLETGSIEAALVGSPPQTPFTRPIVQAPAALTGFAISYAIDDASGHPYRHLKLTPRLLAKLLTESYPAAPAIQGPYSALSGNPLNLAVDPEFRALNPGPPAPGYNTEPAATLFVISGDSDVIWALTSYIQADPEARAWLDGAADPWGMVVNPNYKGMKLPVIGWPLLDTFHSGAVYASDNNPCLASNPVPFLPLVAAPASSLATVSLNMQFGIANSQIICANASTLGQKLVAIGRENPGKRFIIGLTSFADAERYQLDAAALQSHVAASAPEKFTDETGRTFVAPSEASLRAAARMLKPDEAAGTWPIPYAALRTDPKGVGAYPGTMLMSVAVPTKGLPIKDAQQYAQFLGFVAVKGQTPGLGNGQLPPGYLPMNGANGLALQAQYTQVAAVAVAAQAGTLPSVVTLKAITPPPVVGGGGPTPAPPPGTVSPPGVPQNLHSIPRGPTVTAIAVSGKTNGIGAGFAGVVFPLVVLLAVFGALASAITWFFGRPRVGR